jgi:dCTP deaminase
MWTPRISSGSSVEKAFAGAAEGVGRSTIAAAPAEPLKSRTRPIGAVSARRPSTARAVTCVAGSGACALPAAGGGARRCRCPRRSTRGAGIVAPNIRRVVLSDTTIARYLAEGRIEIDPYDEALLQPSSVDVRVDTLFRVFHNNRYPFIDVKVEQEELTELVEVDSQHPFVLHPGEFVLGSTLERVRLPDDLVARLEGKSSLGRLGLLIHSTAGFIDPGWDGHVTLELSNVANLPITIYPGMKIGQISFMQMTEPAAMPYGASQIGSKYKGQKGPTPSRYFKNFQ